MREQSPAPVAGPAPGPLATTAAEKPGDRIGPYKLLEKIGEGGMGTVWMAEQTEPVRRRVALKVIKQGMDSGQVLARFEAERQALALMDHPNIAKVLDAGLTGRPLTPSGGAGAEGAPSSTVAPGRPYFVMELVKGIPLTKYCDEQRLSIRERLELFMPVCQAIQHAHQKGIIHRDIKPSNVLVALYDGNPVPKVIDFGVAKATGQQLTERTLFTGFGAVVGTLEYMSPEQAELNQLDVDTRSDIYSLGVLLYELLTGTTPLTREILRQAAFDEVLRRIREVEPPRPSTRLSESKERLASISAQRKLDPAHLTKQVRGDLDWIAMKALEKDRRRRYDTANGLAADLQHYLSNEPVVARPPSNLYRFEKMVRRNRIAFAAAFAVATALVIGLWLFLWQSIEKSRAYRRAIAAENQQLLQRQQLETAQADIEKKDAEMKHQQVLHKILVQSVRAEIEKQDAQFSQLLTRTNQLTLKMDDLTGAIDKLSKQIADTERHMAASEGDRDFLQNELKRLRIERAELERQFNDLSTLRAQVEKLQDELIKARQLELQRLGFPPRDPQTQPSLIDLSRYYNARLDDDWQNRDDIDPTGKNLAKLPKGVGSYAGVDYDVRGIIQLFGLAYLTTPYPKQVTGIKIHSRCHRVHFLHSTGGMAEDESQIGTYVIHYSDRQRFELPIIYGKDVRAWQFGPKVPNQPETGSVAWKGTNEHSEKTPGSGVRLYKSSWENPRPDVEIASIDFVSSMTDAAPFLIAITVQP